MKSLTFLKGEGGVAPMGQRDPRLQILISIIIDKHTKMLCFKFHKNRTINEEFDIIGGIKLRAYAFNHLYILISINIDKHMQFLRFKFSAKSHHQ